MRLDLHPVRRFVAPLALIAVAAACSREDPRVKNLTAGITKDSAMVVMGGQPPHRLDPYLNNGQYIEALYYLRANAESTPADTVVSRSYTPVVAINGLITGWGWTHWDSVAAAHSIVLPPPQ